MEAPGSIQEFVEKEMDKPKLQSNDVLIEIHATAINPADISLRTGKMEMEDGFPAILGVDISGVVAEIGEDVKNFEVGDQVFTSKKLGTTGGFAEYAAVSEDLVVNKPEEISFEEAASLGIAALTAYQLVNNEPHQLKEDETVFIQSGSGGVGTFAVQFAKQNGAHVIATTSKNEDLLEALDVDEVVNYEEEDVGEKYKNRVDLLIDTAGKGTETLPVVKEGGRAVTVATPFDENKADERNISAKRIGYKIKPNQLKKIAEMIAKEQVKVVIDEVFPFTKEGVQLAHKLSESGHASGKIIVKIK